MWTFEPKMAGCKMVDFVFLSILLNKIPIFASLPPLHSLPPGVASCWVPLAPAVPFERNSGHEFHVFTPYSRKLYISMWFIGKCAQKKTRSFPWLHHEQNHVLFSFLQQSVVGFVISTLPLKQEVVHRSVEGAFLKQQAPFCFKCGRLQMGDEEFHTCDQRPLCELLCVSVRHISSRLTSLDNHHTKWCTILTHWGIKRMDIRDIRRCKKQVSLFSFIWSVPPMLLKASSFDGTNQAIIHDTSVHENHLLQPANPRETHLHGASQSCQTHI